MPNRQRQIEKAKQEMATMYKIIKNDEGEDELSKDQPLLSMIKFNIAIMLDKFKEMGEEIKKLKAENEFLKADTDTDEELPSDVEEDLWMKAMEDAVVYSYTRPTD
tara:strand:- start:2825 stop:3142 length:318 start_codon:yes stop_codon:yes gene_type:complete